MDCSIHVVLPLASTRLKPSNRSLMLDSMSATVDANLWVTAAACSKPNCKRGNPILIYR